MTTIITAEMVWNVANVVSFRGIDVRDGEVSMTDDEYSDMLDELYGEVEICGMSYSAGTALQLIDPVAFRCGKSDQESYLQSELEDALSGEDESDITFDEYEVSDITDEEDEE